MCMCVCTCVLHAPLEELRGRRLGGSDFPWQLTFFPYFCGRVLGFSQCQTLRALEGLHLPCSGSSPVGSRAFANMGLCKPGGDDRAFVYGAVVNKEKENTSRNCQGLDVPSCAPAICTPWCPELSFQGFNHSGSFLPWCYSCSLQHISAPL